ncbi:MAG: DUF4389 domain-containing protein [Microbacteriaceae bacterium]
MFTTIHKQGRMPARQFTMLITGVLLGLAAAATFATPLALPWGPIGLAAGLGRAIASDAPLQAEVVGGRSPKPELARLTGRLDPRLTRWMWLVKWFLAIPHYVVLAFLWVAFLAVTVVAGLAILFTGRYPASLFQFSVGFLRWNWRVAFYAYGVLGTDSYPPFTLARTDYPAEFDVAYPQKLSHWKVLFKSWLFALPQLLIIAAVTGGAWMSSTSGIGSGISLLGLLALIAVVILLFSGVYRAGLFNLVMGIHRWMLRTVAYVALLSDAYPPFRLDQGPVDPSARPLTARLG